MPDLGPIKPYTGKNPNIRLAEVSYDAKSAQLQVKWTATSISQTLSAKVEQQGKELVVVLDRKSPTLQNASGRPTIGAGGAAMTERDDKVQLPHVAKGTTIKVWNGDVLAGTFKA